MAGNDAAVSINQANKLFLRMNLSIPFSCESSSMHTGSPGDET
jgi:hypothetical protein